MANRWTHQPGTADPYNQFATPRDDKLGKVRDPLLIASRWLKRRSQKEKVLLGSVCGLLVSKHLPCLLVGRHQNPQVGPLHAGSHDNLFIMAEFVHFAGIGMLLFKLFSKKNAGGESVEPTWNFCHVAFCNGPPTNMHVAGLSLRSQELSALFLGIRLFCRYSATLLV